MPFYYQSHRPSPPPNAFVAAYRRIYTPTGFHKGYNFPLWIIFAGAALGFCASRAMYLDFSGNYARAKQVTGDWYYQRSGHNHIGLILHLVGVIPIGFLIPWQFLPVIRRKFLLFHRLNGYLLLLLLLIGNAGAFMIARRGLAGTLEAQTQIGILGIATTVSAFLAWYNIKVLQFDQHRAWMLRTWVYAFTIITVRILMLIMYRVISRVGSYYIPMPCGVIAFITSAYGPDQSLRYAECRPDASGVINPQAVAAVHADFYSKTRPDEIGAAIQLSFGMATVLAFFIHAVGVEIYIRLTPAEDLRLKKYSIKRQQERGYKWPGNAGLTVEKWGDTFLEDETKAETVETRGQTPVQTVVAGNQSGVQKAVEDESSDSERSLEKLPTSLV